MDFLQSFKNFEITPMNVLKAAGVLLVALVVLSFAYSIFLKPVADSVKSGGGFSIMPQSASPGYDGYAYNEDASYGYGYEGEVAATLSARNVGMPPPPPRPGGSVGADAEEYEVTEYNVSIETRDRSGTCAGIAALKDFEHVVFESANEHEKGCNYTFKVEIARVGEILRVLENFNPRELTENTYTIKRQLDDFTSETEILKRKLISIDETLESALQAYDEITALATRAQNAEALAKIFDSRIGIIERLTHERINISAQLERLERAKAEQLDKLEYTYFYVNVYENKFVDGKELKDSWKAAVREFVREMNRIVQDVTINLVALLFLLAQYILYLFILFIVGKYLWRAAKYIWQK